VQLPRVADPWRDGRRVCSKKQVVRAEIVEVWRGSHTSTRSTNLAALQIDFATGLVSQVDHKFEVTVLKVAELWMSQYYVIGLSMTSRSIRLERHAMCQ
jgi:hypothetical protein